MDIGTAINQKSFKSEHEKLLINVLYTATRMQNYMHKNLKPHGITSQQYNVLRILRGSKGVPISTNDIRGRMLEPMPDISRLVDRLIAKNLVSKSTTKSDKRLVDVSITTNGLALLERINFMQREMEKMQMSLTTEEAADASRALDYMRLVFLKD